ncbi:MAG TPA: BlaI/MecI/CopY family transcriptional regulator [Puia sp.]
MEAKLTKIQEQIMQSLWKIEKGFLKDILEELPDPKPHSNTVATILKILIEKGFVGIRAMGRLHEYYPLIPKSRYTDNSLKSLVERYFEGSFSNVVSYMVDKKKLSVTDLELLLKQIKKQKK